MHCSILYMHSGFGISLIRFIFLSHGFTLLFQTAKDNHLLLIDLRSKGINGNKAELVCDEVSIVLNKPLGMNVSSWTTEEAFQNEIEFVRLNYYLTYLLLDYARVSGLQMFAVFIDFIVHAMDLTRGR